MRGGCLLIPSCLLMNNEVAVFTNSLLLQHIFTVINKANCKEISNGRSEILFA